MRGTYQTKISRVKAIYFYIKDHEGVSTAELAEEFSVHKRTIERAIDMLQYNELVHSPRRGKWATTARKVKGA